MIALVVAGLTIAGWAVGATVGMLGLGWSLSAILDGDTGDTVQGAALVIWGVTVVQLSWMAARAFTRTFAPQGRNRGTDS